MSKPQLVTPEPLAWPGKWPEEVKDYGFNWTSYLRGDTIVSMVASRMYGHVTINSQDTFGPYTVVVLSGGQSGNVSRFKIVITTSAGRTLEARADIATG